MVVLFNNCPILVTETAWALPPLIAPKGLLNGFDQVYFVFAGTMFPPPWRGVIPKLNPLHIVCVCEITKGCGFTVIVTVNWLPTQLPASPDVGVTV